ncbi:hypothetical protein E4U43_000372 [Claviceps pusilla]|uniref:DUF7582 domain-containing protein n=1 Tax=Claviceps pusilla TaxID=123648 RepID=A0A9P7NA39_9HYPO|nr:hypothetical protein E4U43_000372 [Claviceps pusilla]
MGQICSGPRKTPGSDPPLPLLNRTMLLQALRTVATSVAKTGGNLTVVAVGGAVNTIYLQSRETTRDIDFFNAYLGPDDVNKLATAARDAIKRNKGLGEDWFNSRALFFVPNDKHQALTDEAFSQREIIFEEPGLTVLAAPWNYAFCCKVDRIARAGHGDPRPYDLDDAMHYLARYLRPFKQDVGQIAREKIRAWFVRYSLEWTESTDEVLDRVSERYVTYFNLYYSVIT